MKTFFTIVALVIVVALFIPSVSEFNNLKVKNTEYEQQILQLKQTNVELKEELRRLQEDPAYLEKVAREKMGLVKDGEMIYKLEPAPDEEALGP